MNPGGIGSIATPATFGVPARRARAMRRRSRLAVVAAVVGSLLAAPLLPVAAAAETAPPPAQSQPQFTFVAGPTPGTVRLLVAPGTDRAFVDGLAAKYELTYQSGPEADGSYVFVLPTVQVTDLGDGRVLLRFPSLATPADIDAYIDENDLTFESWGPTDATGHRTAFARLPQLTVEPLGDGRYGATLPPGMSLDDVLAWAAAAGLTLESYDPETGETVLLIAGADADAQDPPDEEPPTTTKITIVPSTQPTVAPSRPATPSPSPSSTASPAANGNLYLRLKDGAGPDQVRAAIVGLGADLSSPDGSGLYGISVPAGNLNALRQLLADSPAVACVATSASACPGAPAPPGAGTSGTSVGAPGSLSGVGDAAATLSWPAASGAAAYAVWRSVSPDGPWQFIAVVGGLGYTDSTVADGVSYYRVTTLPPCSGGGTGCYGNAAPVFSAGLASPAAEVVISGSTATPGDTSNGGGAPGIGWFGPDESTWHGSVTLTVGASVAGGGPGQPRASWQLSGPAGALAIGTAGVNGGSAQLGWDSSAVADGTYTVTVTVTDGFGNTAQADRQVRIANAAPPAPSAFTATAGPDGSVELSWQEPMLADLAGFRVVRDGATIAEVPAATRSLGDAPGQGAHGYTVIAFDTAGRSSAPANASATAAGPAAPAQEPAPTEEPAAGSAEEPQSGPAEQDTVPEPAQAPPAPAPLLQVLLPNGQAVASDATVGGAVTLAAALADGTTSSIAFEYRVGADAEWTPVPGNAVLGTLTWPLTGLQGPVEVRAVAGTGDSRVAGDARALQISSGSLLAKPVGVSISAGTDGVTLDWGTPESATPRGYLVQRLEAGDWVTLAAVASRHYVDGTAPAGASATYRVSALDRDGGVGAPSQPVSVSVPSAQAPATAALVAPGGFRLVVNPGSVTALWAAVTGAAFYRLEVAFAAGGPYTPVGTTSATTLTADSGPLAGVRYFRVSASDALGGRGDASAPLAAFVVPPGSPTGAAAQFVVGSATTPGAPAAPIAQGPGELILSTVASGTAARAADHLDVTAGGTVATPIASVSVRIRLGDVVQLVAQLAPTQLDSGWAAYGRVPTWSLREGRYTVQALALDAAGSTVDTTAAAVLDITRAVAAPTAISATRADGGLRLSWTAPAGTSGPVTYTVWRSLDSGGFVPAARGLTTTSYLDTGLSPGAAPAYVVTTGDDLGNESAFSAAAVAPTASAADPVVAWIAPQPAAQAGGPVLIAVAARADWGIADVALQLSADGGATWTDLSTTAPLAVRTPLVGTAWFLLGAPNGSGGLGIGAGRQDGIWTTTWNAAVVPGTYSLRVDVVDTKGHHTVLTRTVAVTGLPPSRAPPAHVPTPTTTVAPDGTVTVTVGIADAGRLAVDVGAVPAAAPLPASLRGVGPVYEVHAIDVATGGEVHLLDGAATIAFALPADISPEAAALLAVYHYDPSTNTWRKEPSYVDLVRHVIVATVSHFSQFTVATACSADPATAPHLCLAQDEAQVDLWWTPASGIPDSYTLYRSTTPGAEVPYRTGLTGTQFIDWDVTPGTTYYYQLSSTTGGVESARSGEVAATPVAQTSAPAVTGTTLAVGAGAPVPAAGAHFSGTITLAATTTDAVRVTALAFEVRPSANPAAPWLLLGTATPAEPAGSSLYTGAITISTLSPWLTGSYTLRVTATNVGGITAASTATIVSDNGPAIVTTASFDPEPDSEGVVHNPTITLAATGGTGALTTYYGVNVAPGWIELAGQPGIAYGPNGDDSAITGVAIGFAFPFYGASHSTVNICTNGWISFSMTGCMYSFGALPNATYLDMIIAAGADLRADATDIIYKTVDAQTFVVEYRDIRLNGGSPDFSFEIVLHADGTIDLVYVSWPPTLTTATIGVSKGGDTTRYTSDPHSRISAVPPGYAQRYTYDTGTGNYAQSAITDYTLSDLTPYTGPVTVTAAGEYTLVWGSADSSGAAEPVHVRSFTVAPEPATITDVTAAVDGAAAVSIPVAGIHVSKTTVFRVTATGNNDLSQVRFEYQNAALPGSAWTNMGTYTPTLAAGVWSAQTTLNTLSPWLSGTYLLRVTVTNSAGQTSVYTGTLISDNGPALVSTHSIAGTLNGDGYYTTDPIVTLSVTGGVGATSIVYSIDGGASQTYTAPFAIALGGGYHYVTYRATDSTGAQEPSTHSFSITRAFAPAVIGAVTLSSDGGPATPIPPAGAHFTRTITLTATATGSYSQYEGRRVSQLLFEYRLAGNPSGAWTTIGTVTNPTRSGDDYTGSVGLNTLTPWLSGTYELRVTATVNASPSLTSSASFTLISDNGAEIVTTAGVVPVPDGVGAIHGTNATVTLAATGGKAALSTYYTVDGWIELDGDVGAGETTSAFSGGLVAGIPLGFTFSLYGDPTLTASQVRICNYGYVSFGYTGCTYGFPMPSTGYAGIVAPFDYALGYTSGTSRVLYKQLPGAFVVEWKDLSAGTGAVTFEVVLFADGTMEFRYLTMPATISTPSYARVGVHRGDGTHFTAAPGNNSATPPPSATRAKLVFDAVTGDYVVTTGTLPAATLYTAPFVVSGAGAHLVSFSSTDGVNSERQKTTGFSIDDGTRVTGYVRDNNTPAAGLGGIRVGVKDAGGDWIASTLTNAAGAYNLLLTPGTYTITADASSSSLYTTPAAATGVVVTAGAATTVGFTYARWSFVTGRLVDGGGSAIAGATMVAFCYANCPLADQLGSTAARTAYQGVTDATGAFTIAVDVYAGQSYAVQPLAQPGLTRRTFANGGWQYVSVTAAGATIALSPDLRADRNGTISGVVQDDTGAPLAGAVLQISYTDCYSWRSGTSNADCYASAPTALVFTATSGADGSFTISAPVRSNNSLVPQQLPGYSTPAALNVSVGAGTDSAVTARVYARMATVTGTVSSDDGLLTGTVRVQFYGYDAQGRYYSGSAYLGEGGTYSFGVPSGPGSYFYVYLTDEAPGYGYAQTTQYSITAATPASTIVRDFSFLRYGTVSGILRTQDGAAPGIAVHLYAYVQTPGGTIYVCSTSDIATDPAYCYSDPVTGAYSLPVPAGTVRVYPTTILPGSGRPGPAGSTAPYVTGTVVPGSDTAVADLVFVPWVHVTGSVGGDLGALPGAPQLYYYSYDQWGNFYSAQTITLASGGGTFDVLAPIGSTYLAMNADFSAQNWQSPSSQNVTVPAAGLSGITFTYIARGGVIVTTVTSAVPPAPIYSNSYWYLQQNGVNTSYYFYSYDSPSPSYNRVTLVAPGTYSITPPGISGYGSPAAQTFTVVAGQFTSLTFVYTIPSGTIAGTVRDNAGTPVAGARVGTKNGDGTWGFFTTTAADGTYALGIPTGSQTVYAEKIGDSKYTASASVAVTVVQDVTTSGVDLVLPRWAFITGRLVDTSAAPIVGATIVAYCYYGSSCTSSLGRTAVTAADGTFAVAVDPEATYPYAVQPLAQTGLKKLAYAQGGWMPVLATASGASYALEDDLVAARPGTVTGLVTDDLTAALPGATVRVGFTESYGYQQTAGGSTYDSWQTSPTLYYYATTDASGQYAVQAQPGSAVVQPEPLTGYAAPANPPAVTVVSGATTANPTVLVYTRLGTISGHVLKQGGAGPGTPIHLYVTVNNSVVTRTFCSTSETANDPAYCYADPVTGAYSIPVMPGAATVYATTTVTGFGRPGPVGKTTDGATGTVTVNATTTGVDLVLVPWVHITGSTGPDVGILGGTVFVSATIADQWGRGFTSPSLTTPNNGGTFDFLVPVGTATLSASSGFAGYQTPPSQQLTVTAAGLSGLTLTYRRYGTVTIVLQDSSDPPVALTVSDYIYLTNAERTYQFWVPNGLTFASILPGTYTVTAPAIAPYGAPTPQQVVVVAAGTATVTFVYGQFATIVGTVSSSTGPLTPAQLATVVLTFQQGGVGIGTTTPAADGAFTMNVPAGIATTVTASSLDGYDGPVTAPVVTVPAGGTSAAIAVVFTRWGTVIGTVLDNFGAPVVGASITASSGQSTVTDSSGNYVLPLPRGPTTLTAGTVAGLTKPADLVVAAGPATPATVADFTLATSRAYLRNATLIVHAQSAPGVPLAGAELIDSYGHHLITDATGTATISLALPNASCAALPAPSPVPAVCKAYLYPQAKAGYASPDIAQFDVLTGQTAELTLTWVPYGMITGTFTDAHGQPVPGASAWVLDTQSNTMISSVLDPDGIHYTLSAPAGAVVVRAVGLAHYVTPANQSVTVPSGGGTLAGVNLVWARWGFISGNVHDSLTGAPIPSVIAPSVQVGAFDANGLGYLADTDANGDYTIELPPGTYSLFGGVVTNYERPARLEGLVVSSPADPGDAAQHLVRDLAYLPYGTIVGVAQDDAGNPIAGATISSYLSTNVGVQTTTAADGSFAIRVPHTTGVPYTIYGLARPGYVTPAGVPGVTVGIGTTTTLAAPIVYLRYATISGRTLDEVGQPIAGITVTLWQNSLPTTRTAVSDVDGSFSIAAPAGSYVVVGSDKAGFLNYGPTPASGSIAVVAGQVSTGNDLTYLRYLEISGYVTNNDPVTGAIAGRPDLTGNPVANATIIVVGDAPTAIGFVHIVRRVTTDASGRWTTTGPRGSYVIGPDTLPNYDIPGPVSVPNLTALSDNTHFDFIVRHAGIAGVVTDDLGAPIVGATIRITDGLGHNWDVLTDATGHYGYAVAQGTYGVIPRPLAGYTPGAAGGGTVGSGYATLAVNLTYSRDAYLTGVAVDDLGNPVAGVVVQATGAGGAKESATTAPDGSYALRAPVGTATITPGAIAGYETPAAFTMSLSPAAAIGVAGDARLRLVYHSATVHGYARDSFGDPVVGVVIDAIDGTGVYNKAQTDATGYYSMRVRTTTTSLTIEANTAPGLTAPGSITLVGLAGGSDTEVDFAAGDPYTGTNKSFGAAKVAGTLTAAGNPLAGVAVTATSSAGTRGTTTAADGTYEIKVGLGAVTVAAATVPGHTAPIPDPFVFAPLAAGQTGVHDFVYGVNGTIHGVVTDDIGTPLQGVTVTVYVAPDGATGDRFSATTGADGTFTVAADTGAVRISTSRRTGYTTPALQETVVTDGAEITGIVFVFQRNATVTGHLSDSAGNPVYSIVAATAANGDQTWAYSDAATGAYALSAPVFTDGTPVHVQALALDGYLSPPPVDLAITIALSVIAGIDFGYQNALVTGTVVDGLGNPLAGVPILVDGTGGGRSGVTDATGTYRIPAPLGSATVRPGRLAGYAVPATVALTGLVAGQSVTVAPLVYLALGAVSGIVVDEQGQRIAGVAVYTSDGAGNSFSTTTNADGEFTLAAAPGQVTVSSQYRAGYLTPAAQTVTVTSGQTTGSVLLKYSNPVLTGRVVDSNGIAMVGVTVTAIGAFRTTAVTDNTGAFTIKLGLGNNTIYLADVEGYDTPDALSFPALTIGAVGPVTLTYGRYTTVIGAQLRVSVLDAATHNPLDGVTTLLQIDANRSIQRNTNNGDVKFTVDPGDYLLYIYKDGYRPITQQVTSGIGNPTNIVYLTKAEFIVGEVTVRRLTLAEILAAGIDVSAPDNQNIYQFEAHIQLCVTCQTAPLTLNFTASGNPVQTPQSLPPGVRFLGCDATYGCGYGGAGGGGGGGGTIYVKPLPGPPEARPFAYLLIPGEARFLKEFFDINFHVVNTADPAFVLSGTTATLVLPSGMSLASTAVAQTLTHALGDIPGGQDASTDWIVRGDVEGDYYPQVQLHVADLKPFSDVPIDRTFQPKEPVHVYGGSAVKMVFQVPELAVGPVPSFSYVDGEVLPASGEGGSSYPFVVRIGLENATEYPVYLPAISLIDLGTHSPLANLGDEMLQVGTAVWFDCSRRPNDYSLCDPQGRSGSFARPIMLGFGDPLQNAWVQIDPHTTVWATYTMFTPIGGPVIVSQSSVSQTGGNADLKATVEINSGLDAGIPQDEFDQLAQTFKQLTATDQSDGVHLTWGAVTGALTYRVYRSPFRYSWNRQDNLLAEVTGTSYVDASTWNGQFWYMIETVFAPTAAYPAGETHVLHPMVGLHSAGAYVRTPALHATGWGGLQFTLTDPNGVVSQTPTFPGPTTSIALTGSAVAAAGVYTLTVTSITGGFYRFSIWGTGPFDSGVAANRFSPTRNLTLEGTLDVGATATWRIRFDPQRGIQFIDTVADAKPLIESVTPTSGLQETKPVMIVTGSGLVAGATVYLDDMPIGTLHVLAGPNLGQLGLTLPTGLGDGYWDVSVVNPDGSYATLYNAYRVLPAITRDYDERNLPASHPTQTVAPATLPAAHPDGSSLRYAQVALTAPLAAIPASSPAGTFYSTVSVTALPTGLAAGTVLLLGDPLDTVDDTQRVVLAAFAPAGSTVLQVLPLRPYYAYAAGTIAYTAAYEPLGASAPSGFVGGPGLNGAPPLPTSHAPGQIIAASIPPSCVTSDSKVVDAPDCVTAGPGGVGLVADTAIAITGMNVAAAYGGAPFPLTISGRNLPCTSGAQSTPGVHVFLGGTQLSETDVFCGGEWRANTDPDCVASNECIWAGIALYTSFYFDGTIRVFVHDLTDGALALSMQVIATGAVLNYGYPDDFGSNCTVDVPEGSDPADTHTQLGDQCTGDGYAGAVTEPTALVYQAAMRVTGITPEIVADPAGSFTITISGDNFRATDKVLLNNSRELTGVTLNASHQLVVTVPAGIADGEYTVVVKTASGLTSFALETLSILRRARIQGFSPTQANTSASFVVDVSAADTKPGAIIELNGVGVPTTVNADGSLSASVVSTGNGFVISAPLAMTTIAANGATTPGTIAVFTVGSTAGLAVGMTVRFGDNAEEARIVGVGQRGRLAFSVTPARPSRASASPAPSPSPCRPAPTS